MKHTINLLAALLLMPVAASHANEEYPVGYFTHGSRGGSGLCGAEPGVFSVNSTRPDDYVAWKPGLKNTLLLITALWLAQQAMLINAGKLRAADPTAWIEDVKVFKLR